MTDIYSRTPLILRAPPSTGHYLWPHKINFLSQLGYWSWVSDLRKLSIQHATTVLTQSAPSGFTPFWLLILCFSGYYNWVWDTILYLSYGHFLSYGHPLVPCAQIREVLLYRKNALFNSLVWGSLGFAPMIYTAVTLTHNGSKQGSIVIIGVHTLPALR